MGASRKDGSLGDRARTIFLQSSVNAITLLIDVPKLQSIANAIGITLVDWVVPDRIRRERIQAAAQCGLGRFSHESHTICVANENVAGVLCVSS